MNLATPLDIEKYLDHFLKYGKKDHNQRENKNYLEFIGHELTIQDIQDKQWKLPQIKKEYKSSNDRFRKQLPVVINKLKEDSSSRQAVLMNWRESDLTKKNTCPCIISLQFLIRNRLHCIAYLRSSNYATKFKSDISYIRSIILRVMHSTKQRNATLTIFQGSFHTPA